MSEIKRFKNFTITCDRCGSTNCDIVIEDLGVVLECYNEECVGKEIVIDDMYYGGSID